MTTAVHVVEGVATLESTRKRLEEAEVALKAELAEHELDAFPLAVAAPDLRVAATTIVQAWGVGPVRSNSVLLNWFESLRNWNSEAASFWYTRLLSSAIRMRQNVIVLDAEDDDWDRLGARAASERRIDVWWWEDESSRLCLLFAYLMTRTADWEDAQIRLLAPVSAKAEMAVANNLSRRLEEFRIPATIETVVDADANAMGRHSHDAALLFLPLRIAGMSVVDPFGEPIDGLLPHLPVTALVAAAQDIQLRDDEETLPPGKEDSPADEPSKAAKSNAE